MLMIWILFSLWTPGWSHFSFLLPTCLCKHSFLIYLLQRNSHSKGIWGTHALQPSSAILSLHIDQRGLLQRTCAHNVTLIINWGIGARMHICKNMSAIWKVKKEERVHHDCSCSIQNNVGRASSFVWVHPARKRQPVVLFVEHVQTLVMYNQWKGKSTVE